MASCVAAATVMLGVVASALSDSSCPAPPKGWTVLTSHCVGSKPGGGKNCGTAPQQLDHGFCSGSLADCFASISGNCTTDARCNSFTFRASGEKCKQPSSTSTHWQTYTVGLHNAVDNGDWVAYARGSPTPPPGPAPTPHPGPAPTPHPGPAPHPSGIPKTSDCAIRELALEFAQHLLPHRDALPEVYDALELGTRGCGRGKKSVKGATRKEKVAPTNVVYVDYGKGSDTDTGTEAKPVKTIYKALALLRSVPASAATKKAMILRGGVHVLNSTVELSAQDSGLTIQHASGDLPAWISGGLPMSGLKWKPEDVNSERSTNIWVADISDSLSLAPELHSIRLDGRRATAARWPNSDVELDRFPTGYTTAKKWLPPRSFPKGTAVSVNNPSRKNISKAFNAYEGGIGGACSIFDPPFSFWCSGGRSQGFTPSGLQLHTSRNWSNPVQDGAEVFVWRSGHWNNYMFEVGSYAHESQTISFGLGGFQGTRPGGLTEFFVSHVREELDMPGEFFIDRKAAKLYYFHNATVGTPPPADGFVATRLPVLLSLNATASNPIRDVTITGVGLRDARATYLAPHGVPSAGDWALQRSAAIFAEGTERLTIEDCTLERVDGNGIMLSGYNRNATVRGNEIRWTGDSAIALWGKTDELSDDGIHGIDGSLGTHPENTVVEQNLIHELGAFEKQSSMFFQAKSCATILRSNVFFNGPRAGININDGYCGGDTIERNLVFNTCRESGDHGPFNSWDRQPYSMFKGALPVPATRTIKNNLFFADYDGVKGIDHDDGSSFFDDHSNVIYMGWGQKTFKPSPGEKKTWNSLVLFSPSVLTEHGGEASAEFAEKFYNNTVVMTPGVTAYAKIDSCDQVGKKLLQLSNNTYYSSSPVQAQCGKKKFTVSQLQEKGGELGSVNHIGIPADSELVAMAKTLLLLQRDAATWV